MTNLEARLFHAIWWTLAVLLPDLVGFATRDWRAALVAFAFSVGMMALAMRTAPRMRWPA
jgi:hypothetical protein